MDNLDKIKFKHYQAEGWLIKIDGSGQQSFKQGTKFVNELQAYLDAGYKIEEAETADEKTIREEKELEQALESQNQTCIRLLKETDEKVNGAYPNSDADKAKWNEYRDVLRQILNSTEIEAIPPKPYGG